MDNKATVEQLESRSEMLDDLFMSGQCTLGDFGKGKIEIVADILHDHWEGPTALLILRSIPAEYFNTVLPDQLKGNPDFALVCFGVGRNLLQTGVVDDGEDWGALTPIICA